MSLKYGSRSHIQEGLAYDVFSGFAICPRRKVTWKKSPPLLEQFFLGGWDNLCKLTNILTILLVVVVTIPFV